MTSATSHDELPSRHTLHLDTTSSGWWTNVCAACPFDAQLSYAGPFRSLVVRRKLQVMTTRTWPRSEGELRNRGRLKMARPSVHHLDLCVVINGSCSGWVANSRQNYWAEWSTFSSILQLQRRLKNIIINPTKNTSITRETCSILGLWKNTGIMSHSWKFFVALKTAPTVIFSRLERIGTKTSLYIAKQKNKQTGKNNVLYLF